MSSLLFHRRRNCSTTALGPNLLLTSTTIQQHKLAKVSLRWAWKSGGGGGKRSLHKVRDRRHTIQKLKGGKEKVDAIQSLG